MTNRELIDSFLREKALSSAPRTLEYYQENLDKFYSYYQESYSTAEFSEGIPFSNTTKDMYIQYLTSLKNTGIKNTSLHTYHRAVRTFCNWLVKNSYIQQPFTNVTLPRQDPDLILPLTSVEVSYIDNCINRTCDPLRNYLIFHLMLDCGLRRSEVINLQWEDCKLQESTPYIIIRCSKYNKSRMVPLPGFLVNKILEHKKKYYYSYLQYVFLTDQNSQLKDTTIKDLFRKLKIKSGIERLHPHLLRHTFATSFIAGGGNIEYLRIYMGHADYAITQKYLHISFQSQICGSDIYKLDKIFFKNYNN